MSSDLEEFDNFILSNIEKSNDHNFCVYVKPNKNFNSKEFKLVSSKLNDFWWKYCNLVNKGGYKIHYGENIPIAIPLMVNIELSFDSSGSDNNFRDEPYTEEFITEITKCIQEVIMKDFMDVTPEQLICCVFEFPDESRYIIDNKSQNYFVNIRFIFPYCRVEKHTQQTIFRSSLIKKLTSSQSDIYPTLTHQPNVGWNTIVTVLYDNFYPLYGSTINANFPSLLLTHIYSTSVNNLNQLIDNIIILNSYPNQNENSILNPYNHSKVINSQIKLDFSIAPLTFWLPFIFSMDYSIKITNIKPELSRTLIERCPFTPKNEVKVQELKFNIIEDKTKEYGELCKIFIQFLSKQRYNEKNYWLDVGKSIYNTYDGSDEGKKLWIKFTEGSDNFDEFDCDEYYDKFIFDNYLDYKTLAFYARMDNPEDYKIWHDNVSTYYLEESIKTCSEYDIAKAFYQCYWLEFCLKSDKEWYRFKNHRWIKLHKDEEINSLLSEGFKKNYECLNMKIAKQLAESDDENEKEKLTQASKKIMTIIINLKKYGKKSLIIKEMIKFFYDPKMVNFENLNKNIFAIKNGIIETTDTDAVIREGKPQDYITMFSPLNYPHNIHNWAHKDVGEVMTWMNKVFTNHEMMNYFLLTLASRYKSGNDDKFFSVWEGDGDNSKSCVVQLLDYVFGPYIFHAPVNMLYFSGQASSSPTDVFKVAQYCKILIFGEPAASAILDEGLIKALTGNDKNYIRGMFESGADKGIFFSIIIMCNNIPRFQNPDKALKARQGIIRFDSAWVDGLEVDDYVNAKFVKNTEFGKEIPFMAPAFLWVLKQKYKDYCKVRLSSSKPKCMIDHNKKHWESADPYLFFIKENIESIYKQGTQELEQNIILLINDVYSEYKSFFYKTFPGKQKNLPAFPLFASGFKMVFPKYNEEARGWNGYQFKNSGNQILKI